MDGVGAGAAMDAGIPVDSGTGSTTKGFNAMLGDAGPKDLAAQRPDPVPNENPCPCWEPQCLDRTFVLCSLDIGGKYGGHSTCCWLHLRGRHRPDCDVLVAGVAFESTAVRQQSSKQEPPPLRRVFVVKPGATFRLMLG